jgi:spermidine/putrescine transport system ATP-binding protein/putrescine transport system ATP-binding protein
MNDTSDFVSVRNVSKHFGLVRALDGVSMNIRRGEFFALLGASGCGKTTLLRILGGLESPTVGSVYMDGQDMTAVPPERRPVNMVFQNYAIFPHLNVQQNIGYGLRKDRLSRENAARRVEEALRLVKLEGLGERLPTQISGGQAQRVALARALIKRPKVLLLDEPLSALDKALREQMRIELRALQQSVGVTFVFVTHDQEEALSMADRIAVMSAGKVLQVDTPERLYEAPATREVGAFIGVMNFIPGSVCAVEQDLVEVDAGKAGTFRVAGEERDVAVGSRVVIAIRPEKLSVSDQPPANGANALRGRLTASSYLGDRSHFFVQVEGLDQPVSVASQNDLQHKAFSGRIEAGAEIWLSWAPAGGIVLADDERQTGV